jgi:hypothetical protein
MCRSIIHLNCIQWLQTLDSQVNPGKTLFASASSAVLRSTLRSGL